MHRWWPMHVEDVHALQVERGVLQLSDPAAAATLSKLSDVHSESCRHHAGM